MCDMNIQNNAPYARTTVPEHVAAHTTMTGPTNWECLPNMRVGAFLSYRENGQRAYVTLGGRIVCHHGEVCGSIRAWLSHEKALPIVRRSTCDCTDTRGLDRSVKAVLPPQPSSYYELLCTATTERVNVDGEPNLAAIATPLLCESGPVALAEDGRFFCGHGHSFVVKRLPTARGQNAPPARTDTAIKKKQVGRRRYATKECGCRLVLPNRAAFPELPFTMGAGSEISDA